jgi:ATP-binding cassette subfamily B protein
MSADEILVIRDGVIVERGTHRELVPMNGVYTELYETQFRRALDEHTRRMQEQDQNQDQDQLIPAGAAN